MRLLLGLSHQNVPTLFKQNLILGLNLPVGHIWKIQALTGELALQATEKPISTTDYIL